MNHRHQMDIISVRKLLDKIHEEIVRVRCDADELPGYLLEAEAYITLASMRLGTWQEEDNVVKDG